MSISSSFPKASSLVSSSFVTRVLCCHPLNLIVLTAQRRVNSKATLKADLRRLLQLVPALLHRPIKDSRFCTKTSETVVISSDDSRSQSDNKHRCQIKLYDMIIEAAKSVVPGETSADQKQRVRSL